MNNKDYLVLPFFAVLGLLMLVGGIALMLTSIHGIGSDTAVPSCGFYANWAVKDLPARCLTYFGVQR